MELCYREGRHHLYRPEIFLAEYRKVVLCTILSRFYGADREKGKMKPYETNVK